MFARVCRRLYGRCDDAEPVKSASSVLPLVLATQPAPGEVCSMRWSQLNLQSATWHLPEEVEETRKLQNELLSPFALIVQKGEGLEAHGWP